jgi:hypothetical protein
VENDSTIDQIAADNYFAIIPEWVLDAPISSNAVRCYALLQRYANHENRCWPSRTLLAKRMRCSTDTVDRAIKELVANKAISLQSRKTDAGNPTSNVYTLHLNPQGVAAPLRRGSRKDAEGVAAQMRNESKKKNQSQEELTSSSVDDGFTEFWAMYPRKIGKGAARTAYRRALKKTEHPNILTALHLYNLTRPQDPQYIPHPATWLNQERWADETENLHPTNKPDPQPQWQPCGNCWNGWIELDNQTLTPCTCRKGQP